MYTNVNIPLGNRFWAPPLVVGFSTWYCIVLAENMNY